MAFLLNPKRAFTFALILLLACGFFSTYTIYKLYSHEKWLRHSYEVQLSIAAIEKTLTKAGRARSSFVTTGDEATLKDLDETKTSIAHQLHDLQALVSDNPSQVARALQLREAATHRMDAVEKAVQLKKSALSDLESQAAITAEIVRWAAETSAIAASMDEAEDQLLQQRGSVISSLFGVVIAILFLTFCLSALLFWVYYKMLNRELIERRAAERNAQILGAALMRAQDEERRKFARELHDSVGQLLTSIKMTADRLASRHHEIPELASLSTDLRGAINETRTLSHLLYPPLLDELGLVSAIAWFTEGFSQRTGIPVAFDRPADSPALSKDCELTLFRVLQESLANVHRHSKSPKAEVKLSQTGDQVTLHIKDFGVGIRPEQLDAFQTLGVGVGIGLAGMKDRLKERAGQLNVSSSTSGTAITATLPAQPSPAVTTETKTAQTV
jgi:signal transduction histidine kinase